MIGGELDVDFRLQPNRALLLLEAEGLLTTTPPESSHLRRGSNLATSELKIVWDTRRLPAGGSAEKIIFLARRTDRFDTHTQVPELLNEGHVVIAQQDCLQQGGDNQADSASLAWSKDLQTHPNLICVSSADMARQLLLQCSSEVHARNWTTIAITGTNGKTSTTQIAGTMLEELSQKSVLRLGTLGIQIAGQIFDNPFPTQPDFAGLLASLRMAEKTFTCNQLIMEATSIGIAEGRLGHWPVQCAAFLNLTQDHLDYHGSMSKYLDAKLDLFRRHLHPAGQVVLNCEDPEWQKVVRAAAGKTRLCVGFGKSLMRDAFFAEASVHFSGVRYLEVSHQRSGINGIAGQWTLWLDKQTSVAQCQYQVRLLGAVQHENVSAAAAMMVSLGYPLAQIGGVCQSIGPIHGRLEPVSTSDDSGLPAVLVDYAHSPDALEKTLQTCRALLPREGELICVFGCGGDRDPVKRPIMGKISAQLADKTWITSDNPRTENPQKIVDDILKGIPDDRSEFTQVQIDRSRAICDAIAAASERDIILIAGKGHEDYQIIGATKYPFSDSEVARQALKSKRKI
ncbi:MAG: UDP-N-acetylmuramoylalanyl-D-glutamyl-2,6-diaminopimelate ligase [Pseudomonadota bacterium]|jgi:UDP-N-acetylmuramyl-tripeptide synthetase